jgi:hypothetical protein
LEHRRPPAVARGRQGDLTDDQIDDAGQDRVLVGDVLVQGHRLDAEFLTEFAHGQCLGAVGIGERDGGSQHSSGVQRFSPGPARAGS